VCESHALKRGVWRRPLSLCPRDADGHLKLWDVATRRAVHSSRYVGGFHVHVRHSQPCRLDGRNVSELTQKSDDVGKSAHHLQRRAQRRRCAW
jgi:hypothetical protein